VRPLEQAIDLPEQRRVNRSLITASIVLASIMPAVDSTIANVALPSMGGSMSASADQITWVLTSYIVSMAVMTPVSGWLANRFGRKPVFLISVVGFTITSGLCGAAQNLEQVILFRALQGALGAPMGPLSQAVILDAYDLEERGPALAVWTMGMMVAPIMGPVLGGHLTEHLSWRWVFYINLPVGVLAALGVAAFIPEGRRDRTARLDVAGWALLGLFIVALQMMLDRGQQKGWLQSPEIVTYAVVAAIALYLFVVHICTARRPFLPLGLIRDRNLVASTLLMMVVMVEMFSSMALIPMLMQNFMGYPVEAAGWALAPRGVAALASSYLAGRMVGKVEDRALIFFGLCAFALSFWQMSELSPDMDARLIITSGLVQGFGSSFVFIPLTTLAFATLGPELRPEATGFYNLARNLGGSVGIAVMMAAFTRDAASAHGGLAEFASPANPLMRPSALNPWYDLGDPTGLAALNGEVTRQASIAAYVSVFHVLALLTLTIMPLVLLIRRPRRIAI
jgi:DHA2 family multidrug resistance protein